MKADFTYRTYNCQYDCYTHQLSPLTLWDAFGPLVVCLFQRTADGDIEPPVLSCQLNLQRDDDSAALRIKSHVNIYAKKLCTHVALSANLFVYSRLCLFVIVCDFKCPISCTLLSRHKGNIQMHYGR